MPNSWSKQAYVQGFHFESVTFKNAVNMFERMKIAEYIYEYVVEPSQKIPTLADANRAGHRRKKRGEAASSWNRPRRVRSLTSAENDMYTARQENQKPVSSTAPDMIQKNVMSWENSELSTLIVGLLRTAGAAQYTGKN